MNLTGTSPLQLQTALERLRASSIPQLVSERAIDEGAATAVRYKKNGVFQALTWSRYQDEIRRTAAGLYHCGLRPGARMAIMGDVCIEYVLDRGTFADVPFEKIVADFRTHYPALVAKAGLSGDFQAEAIEA